MLLITIEEPARKGSTGNNWRIDMSKTLPKSLHTVTALIRVSRFIAAQNRQNTAIRPHVREAMVVLGLDTMDDSYGLEDQAVKGVMRG